MPRTDAAKGMDDLQSRLRPFLKEHGFRMQGRTCNRITSDGLTHVINFQMSRFDPPGTHVIAGHRENFYGTFTVNVGVYVPEVAIAQYGRASRAFVLEVECSVRTRLGLLSGESDIWWKLPADAKTENALRLRFERDAFPFLGRLEDRDSLLRELELGRGSFAPRIPRAIILAARGQSEEAKELLREQILCSNSAKHSEYVQQLADRLGLGLIAL